MNPIFKLSKLVKIWGLALFYCLFIYLVFVVLHIEPFSIKQLIINALVVFSERYWFATAYVLLYISFPFINYAIKAMPRKVHLSCCLTFTMLFVVVQNVVYFSDYAKINFGYSYLWLIYLYIIAAYIRLYVPFYYNKKTSFLIGYVCLALFVCAERFLAQWLTPYIFGTAKFVSLFYNRNSILLVGASLCLFMLFRALSLDGLFANKLISKTSPLVFAVYLIHEQPTLRPHLWEWLNPGQFAESPVAIPYVIVCTITIFLVCCGIEWVRKTVSDKIGFSKLAARVCDQVQAKIEEQFSKVE